MGSELLGNSYSREYAGVGGTKQPTLSYTDIFYQCLPHYLAMGMSADEFWNCDPKLYPAYREMDRIKNEKENERLWLQGAYVYQAILLTAPALNIMQPKEPSPYPEKPFDLGLRIEEEHEPTDEEIKQSATYAAVMDWAMRVNKQKRGETDGR